MSKAGNSYQREWYAIMVRSQNEFSLSRLLNQKFNIKTFVPSRKVWKKGRGKIKVFNKPLFSSYVFVNLDIADIAWRQIYRCNGVFDFVRHGSAPASIPEEQIESVARMAASDQPVHEMEYLKGLKLNDRVEVVEGPLIGAVGYFMRASKEVGKFVVNIDLFHRSLVTELEAGAIRPY